MRDRRCMRCGRRDGGAVLVLLLAISAVVATLGTGMLTLGYQTRIRATRTAQDMAARVAADAGLTHAIHTLQTQFDDGSLDLDALPSQTDASPANFEGTFTYSVTSDESGQYTITCVGTFQDAERTVEATLGSSGMSFSHALFAQSRLTLYNSARIEEYNSQPGGAPLKIGTNSTDSEAIVLKNGSYVDGDVVVGAGGDPSDVIKDEGGTYTGSVYAQGADNPLPSVVVPGALASASSQGQIRNDITISSSGKYSNINLGNSEALTIEGDIELYVTGDVVLGNSAEIRISEGSSLILYLDGDIEGKNGSQFNNLTEDPARLIIMGTETCADIRLKNSGDMYAVIYAPQAAVISDNSATIWGSITADTCDLKNSATLYYDASLADQSVGDAGTLELGSWREY